MLIDIIAGARPNFMKIAPIIKAIKNQEMRGGRLRYRLIHTGQHYDAKMSGDFFRQLDIPEPDHNLDVGSGSQASQTAAIMVRYEGLLSKGASDLCLVVGDVTSTMACAITAQKMKIPVAHVEGGIRSRDWTMPEEINRLVTDAITNIFFTTSVDANRNLRNSGIQDERIFFVGNTMIDTLLSNMHKLKAPEFFDDFQLNDRPYFVLTLHRPNNVDEGAIFRDLLVAVAEGARGLPVIFPVHPRTAKSIKEIPSFPDNIRLVDPQPYLEFNFLVKNAYAVITDSGGVTEETTVLGIPCITLRNSTERPETVSVGTNELVGTDPEKLKPVLDQLFEGRWKKGGVPENWDGHAAERIVDILSSLRPGMLERMK